MSKKKKKSSAKKAAAMPVAAKKTRAKLSRHARRIILFSLLGALILGALVGGFFGIRAALGYGRDFNYLDKDLSKYVTISEEDFKKISMVVAVDKPTEEDAEREITSLLVQYKKLPAGASDPDDVIQNGSVVSIYYSGYILSEDGDREYFSGGSNLSTSAQSLVIGSASFIPGFEEGLIGIRPSDTAVPTIVSSGTLSEGDVVYANIEGFHPSGKNLKLYGQRLVLTPELDEEYGEGFYELLLGSELGKNVCTKTTILPSAKDGEGDFAYQNLRSLYKTEGGKPYTVEAYFPLNYGQDNLNGKTAYFDIYIENTTTHTLPEFTDAFLTETVGILPEKLADYEGSTLTEKYRSYVWKALEQDYESRLLDATEKKFWEKIVSVAEVKRVPRSAMLEVYDSYILDLESTYQSYLTSMGTTSALYPFDTFCSEYFANSLSEGEHYTSYIKRLSKQTAGEKIIFFYAIQLLGVAPSESELSAAYEEILDEFAKQNCLLDESYVDQQKTEEEKKAAYEEYMAEIAKTREGLLEVMGEEYFLESAYYNYSFPKLLALTKITYEGKGHN